MAKNKGFDGKRSDTFVYDPDDIVVVGVDTDDGPEHPLYDERVQLPPDDGTIASIIGTEERPGRVLVPILIVKYEGKNEQLLGKPAVEDGRQRVLNARRAKALIKERKISWHPGVRIEAKAQPKGTDALDMMLDGTAANEIRTDDDMLVKSQKAERMRDRGATVEQIAISFGVSTKAIEQWFALTQATAKVKHAVQQGQLSPTAASKIAKLEGKDAQEEALAEVLAAGKATARAAKAAVQKRSGKDDDTIGVGKKIQKKLLDYATGLPTDDKDPYWEGARDVLRVILGDKAKAVAGKMKTALRKCGAGPDECGEG